MKCATKHQQKQAHKRNRRVRQPLRGPELTSDQAEQVVNWKDLVFFSPRLGTVITYASHPVSHAKICRWLSAPLGERDKFELPRIHSSHFYITTIQMIGIRKVDYASLKNAYSRLARQRRG